MLHLLFTVIFSQATLILLLLFKTPLRKLLILSLDKLKRGRGPIVVKTVGATILVVFVSTVYSIFEIQGRGKNDEGTDLNPTDQVLLARNLLEASLMGFIMFLALMMDRLHHYIRELRLRRKTMEALNKNEAKLAAEGEAKAREQQAETFKKMNVELQSELEGMIKEANTSKAAVEALKRQSEGLLLEYDRLLAENQELRDQLKALDQRYSHTTTKKDS